MPLNHHISRNNFNFVSKSIFWKFLRLKKMKIQNNILLVGLVLMCLFEVGLAKANCTTAKPTLKTGQTYTMNQNCTMGKTYNANGTHCNCWSYCGYICTPMSSGNNCTAPTVPSGSKWVSNVGCTNGTTYNTPTPVYHCHCSKRCGYICDPKK